LRRGLLNLHRQKHREKEMYVLIVTDRRDGFVGVGLYPDTDAIVHDLRLGPPEDRVPDECIEQLMRTGQVRSADNSVLMTVQKLDPKDLDRSQSEPYADAARMIENSRSTASSKTLTP
jgi:hypothetical protein